MRRLNLAEWRSEREASDPSWAREEREAAQRHGPPRKVRFLVDENLGDNFAQYVSSVPGFRGITAPSGVDDKTLWALAWQKKIAILTADHDFWDDHRYPLQRCPGVILLVGPTEGAKAVALANLEHQWGFVALCRATPGFHLFLKITARDNGSVAKFWDGRDVVTVEV
ncbi:MAG: DUF5615 family PIN-like protein [Candidatus Limnocylindrales bacterium]